MNYQIFQNY